jgi:hypothetical protein
MIGKYNMNTTTIKTIVQGLMLGLFLILIDFYFIPGGLY